MSSVEEYIEKFPEEKQEALYKLRTMLLVSCPGLHENMQNSLPTYGKNGEVLFAFASQKHHFSFYACHYDLLEEFKSITERYNCGKSCIRFRKCDEQVLNDLKNIAIYIYKNVKGSAYHGNYRMKN